MSGMLNFDEKRLKIGKFHNNIDADAVLDSCPQFLDIFQLASGNLNFLSIILYLVEVLHAGIR